MAFDEMTLWQFFKANDKVIADLYKHLASDGEDLQFTTRLEKLELLNAAMLLQTFTLAHNLTPLSPNQESSRQSLEQKVYTSYLFGPILEVLQNVFNFLKEENPLNLAYVTHCSHDFQLSQMLSFL
jgi:hypothetical protein